METIIVLFFWTLGIVSGLICIYIVLPHIFKKILKKYCLSALNNSNYVYLTFDDGPDAGSTLDIVNLLNRYNALGTFFLLGKNIEKNEDIAEKITQSGHCIGNHGFNHIHPWMSGPIKSMMDLLSSAKYHSFGDLFRPPYGKLNLISMIYILTNRIKVVFWDVDPRDYNSTSAEEVAEFVVKRAKPGSVILLHDGRTSDRFNNPDITVNAVEIILEKLTRIGYQLNGKIGDYI
ncbi:polysaccharide deacetylase family protein [Thermodesulfobacteriota bacterium]